MKILYAICTNQNGRHFEFLYDKTKFIERMAKNHELYFMSNFRENNKNFKEFHDKANNIFKKFIDFRDYLNSESWKESYSILDEKIKENQFDCIFLVGISVTKRYGDEEKCFGHYERSLQNDEAEIGWKETFFLFKNLMIPYYYGLKHKIPIYQFTTDTWELSFKKVFENAERYLFYVSKKLDAKYFPFIEYHDFMMTKHEKLDKKFDFTFGMTNSNKDIDKTRGKYVEQLLELRKTCTKDNGYNIFIRDKKIRKIDDFANYHDYLSLIEQSKYTLMLPAYDNKEFSMPRYIEGLSRECIPFITYDCMLEDAFSELIGIKNIIDKYNLIVNDLRDIPNKIQNLNCNEIINEIKNTKEYINFNNKEFYDFYFDELEKDMVFKCGFNKLESTLIRE